MTRMLLVALFSLAACADPHEPLSADFGNAVRTNIDAQVVNPMPPLGLADTNGQRIDSAIRRYKSNQVYVPRPESATPLDTTTSSTSTSTSTAPGMAP